MQQPDLILISGRMGAGKTKLATRISQFYPGYEIVALADMIRRPICEVLNESFDAVKFNHQLKATFRPVLQAVGQFMRDRNGTDYWANQLSNYMAASESEYFIVDDVRFVVERDSLEKPGALHIHLSSTEEDAHNYLKFRGVDDDEERDDQVSNVSEQEVDQLAEMANEVIRVSGVSGGLTPVLLDGFALETTLRILEGYASEPEST